MQRITLQNGQSLSRIAYGMWRLGDDQDQSRTHVQRKIESCLAQGITTMDQADIYGDYASEEILGRCLSEAKQLRDQIEIVTKCDIKLISDKYPERKVKYYDTSAQHINESVNNSLRLMCIEQIDLLLIHRPDPLMDHRETGAALDALVDSGKVKAVGVSNFKLHDWNLLQSGMKHVLQTNQVELSLLASESLINGDIAFMQQMGIPPMAWSPLGGGQLFSPTDDNGKALLAALQGIATEQGVSVDAVAVAWLLRHPSQIMPVLGTNNLERIAQLADALKVELSTEAWFDLYTQALGQEVP